MKLAYLTGLCCLLCIGVAHAQTDTTIFNVLKKAENNEYVFSVPDKWTKLPQIDNAAIDQKYEFTDVGLPHLVGTTPLTANFILRKLECDSSNAAVDFIINEFTSYPDRITPAGYNYLTDSLQIASGEMATLLTTHYYRRTKVSNFTRYDLIAYSHKRKAAYMLTITFQYKDPTYMCEVDLKMKRYATRVFKTLLLR